MKWAISQKHGNKVRFLGVLKAGNRTEAAEIACKRWPKLVEEGDSYNFGFDIRKLKITLIRYERLPIGKAYEIALADAYLGGVRKEDGLWLTFRWYELGLIRKCETIGCAIGMLVEDYLKEYDFLT